MRTHMIITYCAITELATKICSKKVSVLKKAYLHSSCSTIATNKFKRVPVEEFFFSEMTVLEPLANNANNELLYSHFPKILITIVECIL